MIPTLENKRQRRRAVESVVLMTIIVWAIVMLSVMGLIHYASVTDMRQAVHCSRILHGYKEGTLIPLTEDASVEIGACLLRFNQQLTGENNG